MSGALIITIFVLLYSFSFLGLGLSIALKALDKRLLPKEFLYIGSLAGSLAIYYVIFYVYLFKPFLAGLLVKLILLSSLVLIARVVQRARQNKNLSKLILGYFFVPLLITSVAFCAYSTVFYSCIQRKPELAGHQEMDNRTFCHTAPLPIDNSLGFIYAQNVLRNEDKKLLIDWYLVDRPPLQIASVLPILDQASGSQQVFKYFYYHLFSVFLQLSWIGAFWGMFQILKIRKNHQILSFIALATTGFFYLNSVFVWPKLLAASLVSTGIFILLLRGKEFKSAYIPFAALLIALGMLSHSAVIFTLLPFGAYYLYKLTRTYFKTKKIDYRNYAVALGILLVLLVPWYAYKNSVVKTDRLVKWHFAGIITTEDKRGTVKTVVDEYKKLTFSRWVSNKKENAKTLITGGYNANGTCQINREAFVNKCIFAQWRTITFFSTFFAFEFTGFIGWLAVAYAFIRRKLDHLDKELMLITGSSILFWALVMFERGGSIVHAGSYATMMLIFLLLIKKLSELPVYYLGAVVAMQVPVFYVVWIASYIHPVLP